MQLRHGDGRSASRTTSFSWAGLAAPARSIQECWLGRTAFLFQAEDANRFEHAQRAVGVGGVFRLFEADRDVALRGEVVRFGGLHLLDDADQAAEVGEIAVVQDELAAAFVRFLIEMVDAVGVEE